MARMLEVRNRDGRGAREEKTCKRYQACFECHMHLPDLSTDLPVRSMERFIDALDKP